jgi:ribosomal protein S18 acetylase RimI-like enzyme
MEWTLRSASELDREFLYALHRTTMREVIDNTWGWDDAWQRADFDQRFGTCAVSIIDSQGHAVGGLWLKSTSDSLHIVELQLLPEMQGRGIGSAVVKHVIQQGIDRGLPVTLSVVPANPRAQRLYERLGFEVTGVDAPFILMRHRI